MITQLKIGLLFFSARKITFGSSIQPLVEKPAVSSQLRMNPGCSTSGAVHLSPTKRPHVEQLSPRRSVRSPWRFRPEDEEDKDEWAASMRELGADVYRGLREVAKAISELPILSGPPPPPGYAYSQIKRTQPRFGRGGKR